MRSVSSVTYSTTRHPRRIALGEPPGLGIGEIAVRLRHHLEHRVDVEMQLKTLHVPARQRRRARRRARAARDRPAWAPALAPVGHAAAAVRARSSSASAARGCRDRWRGRRSCAARSPRASNCRPVRTAFRAGRNSAPDRARRSAMRSAGLTTLPTDFDIFSPRLNRNPCTTICFGSGSPATSGTPASRSRGSG